VGRAGEQRRDVRRRLDDLFEVVQQHQQPLVPHVLDQAVIRTDRRSDRPLDEGRVAERLQRDPEDAVGELLHGLGRELKRQAGLTAAPRPREGQQAMRADERAGLRELALAADEWRWLDRQIRLVERPQRREVAVAELVQALRPAQVLEAVLAKVAKLRAGVEQTRRRLGQEYLAAVPGAHDPRRPMHVGAYIPLLGHDRLACVETHPHAHGSLGERVLGLTRSGDRIAGARERDEERIPLRVHLDPAVPQESLTQQAPVLREHLRIPLAELVQKAGRALDVREKQSDGSARKLPHAHMIAPRRRSDKKLRPPPRSR